LRYPFVQPPVSKTDTMSTLRHSLRLDFYEMSPSRSLLPSQGGDEIYSREQRNKGLKAPLGCCEPNPLQGVKIMANQGGTRDQHVQAGQQSHKNTSDNGDQQQAERQEGSLQQGGHRGGSGNFAEDRQRASEEGRKGGKS
jgi:hypothetical protein